MKHLLSTISIVCLILVSYTAVNGAEWVCYGGNSNGIHFYDKESITSDGKGIIKTWSKIIYSEEGKQGYIKLTKRDGSYRKEFENLSYTTTLYVFKCDTREYDAIYGIDRDSKGSQIDTISKPTLSYKSPAPETAIEKLYEIVCKETKKE